MTQSPEPLFRPVPIERPGGGRVTDKTPPSPEDLVEVAGFGRPVVPLHRLAAQAWAALMQTARAEGIEAPLLLPVSGYRSVEEQAWLWQGALEKYGDPEIAVLWVARPGTSGHHSGRAVDCHLGHPIESECVPQIRKTAVYQWLVVHAEGFGFYPYDVEPWHWEYNPPWDVSAEVSGVTELLASLPEGADSTRMAAFSALRRGEALTPEDLARNSGLPASEVARHVAAMVGVGMARLDDSGRVVASDGLSVVPTPHRLILDGVALFTWCAIDIIGIPAALGSDAVASTACGHCRRPLELRFRRGEPEGAAGLAVWAPGVVCSSIVEEFCPDANLFCSAEHLDAWRAQAGSPPGEVLSVDQAIEAGRPVWVPLRGDR